MIVSPCSSRKKASAEPGMHAAALASGSLSDVAQQWRSFLRTASRSHIPQSLYGGRAFTEAARAAKSANLAHYIISAGLGVVGPNDRIPAYAMTTVGSTDENVLKKCPYGTTASDWWKAALNPGCLADLIGKSDERVFLALPSVYLEMVQDELTGLSAQNLEKIRIFTGGGGTLKGGPLEEYVMPYDTRLDGPDSPIPGTKSDFSSRALRHFIELMPRTGQQTLSSDKALASRALAGMRKPILPVRVRVSDADIREALISAWAEVHGNRQKLLRHVRDVLRVSCEQSRFARIAREIEEEKLC